MTIPTPFAPKYQERTDARPTHGDECIMCGRRTASQKNTLFGWVVDGGSRFARLDETGIDERGDMGMFPVGSECAKAFPEGYLTKVDAEADAH
jgi:hypothetical protein